MLVSATPSTPPGDAASLARIGAAPNARPQPRRQPQRRRSGGCWRRLQAHVRGSAARPEWAAGCRPTSCGVAVSSVLQCLRSWHVFRLHVFRLGMPFVLECLLSWMPSVLEMPFVLAVPVCVWPLTPAVSRARKLKRGTSGSCRASAPVLCSAQDVTGDAGLSHPSGMDTPICAVGWCLWCGMWSCA
jgi:hypothetical protein